MLFSSLSVQVQCRTPIFHAIRTKNETNIRTLSLDERANINWQDQRRQAPLVKTTEMNLLSTPSLLSDVDPYVNMKDVKHRPAPAILEIALTGTLWPILSCLHRQHLSVTRKLSKPRLMAEICNLRLGRLLFVPQ